MWQTDFKGDFLLRNLSRCFPLDILNGHVYFCIRTESKTAKSGVKETSLRAFEEYGLPDLVLSDNGCAFLRHSQTQEKLERLQRTIKQKLLCTVLEDLEGVKERFAF